MANLYVGVSGTARKVKKMYVGVNGVARKVKKLYVGVNGIARKVFGGEPSYYGKAQDLYVARHQLSAATIGDYALFGGGKTTTSDSSAVSSVDSYDKFLTKGMAPALSITLFDASGTNVGSYALFAGGSYRSGYITRTINYVQPYDSSLTKGTVVYMKSNVSKPAVASLGNLAFIGNDGNEKNVFDTSLTRTNPDVDWSNSRNYFAGAAVGEYAVFYGGVSGSDYLNAAYAYNSSLTITTLANGSLQKKARHSAATIGGYALFGSGYNGGAAGGNAVVTFDGSLTRSSADAFNTMRQDYAATATNEYAVFGGGKNAMSTGDYPLELEMYDASLTHTTNLQLSTQRIYDAATTVGEYVLFGGGANATTPTATVDVYSS